MHTRTGHRGLRRPLDGQRLGLVARRRRVEVGDDLAEFFGRRLGPDLRGTDAVRPRGA